MAIRYAVASGNWSNTATWNDGTLPTSADDVYSNTFTVTIDISPTVLSVQNGATTGVTAGGGFILDNGVNLTCTSNAGVTGSVASVNCVTFSLASPNSATITASLNCNTNSATAAANTLTGTLNVIGNVRYPSGSFFASSATLLANTSTGTLNVIGDLSGHASGAANQNTVLTNTSGGTVNITGNVINGSHYGNAIINSGSGTMTITGTVAGAGTANGTFASAVNSGTGTLNIIGAIASVQAITASNGLAVVNSSSGTFNHTGSVQASTQSPAIGAGSATQVTILSGPFLTASNGMNPVIAQRWLWANSNVTPTYYQIRTANLTTIRPLYTADSVGGNPAVSNVRSGTIYGPNNELTGTCAVPGAASVMIGVPVDNTVGTAAISASDIKEACSKAIVPALLALG